MNWKSRPRVGMVQYASVSVSLAVARSEILSFLRKGEPCLEKPRSASLLPTSSDRWLSAPSSLLLTSYLHDLEVVWRQD